MHAIIQILLFCKQLKCRLILAFLSKEELSADHPSELPQLSLGRVYQKFLDPLQFFQYLPLLLHLHVESIVLFNHVGNQECGNHYEDFYFDEQVFVMGVLGFLGGLVYQDVIEQALFASNISSTIKQVKENYLQHIVLSPHLVLEEELLSKEHDELSELDVKLLVEKRQLPSGDGSVKGSQQLGFLNEFLHFYILELAESVFKICEEFEDPPLLHG